MTDYRANFAANLRNIRKKLNLSQYELGQKIGYTEKAVSKWECGNYIPDIHVLINLANEFNITIDELIRGNDSIYFLGIDGGGTKTAFVLEDENGNCFGKHMELGCNPFDVGMKKSKEILRSGITKICMDIPMSQVVLFAGIAGGISGGNKKIFQDFFSEFNFRMAISGSDIENIISMGLKDNDGIALIMGTGVSVFCKKDDSLKKILGWGYFFDEGGSAFNFGRDALSRTYSVADGIYDESVLTEMVKEKAGCTLNTLLNDAYGLGKKYIAEYAECVFNAAEKGDGTAVEIIHKNMSVVAEALRCGAKYLNKDSVDVVIAGGLTNEPGLIHYLQQEVGNEIDFRFRILDKEPVHGAIRLARKYWTEKN